MPPRIGCALEPCNKTIKLDGTGGWPYWVSDPEGSGKLFFCCDGHQKAYEELIQFIEVESEDQIEDSPSVRRFKESFID